MSSFVDAVIEDKRGEIDRAISLYHSDRLEGVPAATYNLANLYHRKEEPRRAAELYKKYLEQSPSAPDRAAVQKLIEQLEKTPFQVVVDGDDFDAVVFIDGKPAGPSPLVTTLTDGWHTIDRIGPETYENEKVEARPMWDRRVTGSQRDQTGNVVLSSSYAYNPSWKDGDKRFNLHSRFTLPPGRVDTFFMEPGRGCSPISFDVPKDGVVFVYLEVPRDPVKSGCTPIKVTAQKITFPKVKP